MSTPFRPASEPNQRRFSRADLVRLAVSFVLAIFFWGWVTSREDPEDVRLISEVPVEVGELPGTLQVVTELPPVDVELRGPQSAVSEVRRADVTARLVLSDVTGTGTYQVPIAAEAVGGVRSARAEPAEAQIEVQETVSENFELGVQRPDLTGDPRQVGDVIPAEDQVTVTGPREAVEAVERVLLAIEVGEETSNFTSSFQPVAIDAAGEELNAVSVQPSSVSAFVRITERGKSVAVLPQTVGEPAEGYAVVERWVQPREIVIDGPGIDEIVFVRTEPVDISGATELLTIQTPLAALPLDVRVVEPASPVVDVIIEIRPVGVDQPLPAQPVAPVGLSSGLEASITPATVDVAINAAEDRLEQLQPGDVTVLVDLTGLTPGTHTIQPEVIVPAGVTWDSTDPAAVEVNITAAPAPGPEGSPSPQP